MASPNIHPEFGYLCTSPRWRRDLSQVIRSGRTVIGAGAICLRAAAIALSTMRRTACGNLDLRGETRPLAQAKATPAATVNDRAPSGTGAPDASEPERAVSSDTASSDAGKNDAAKDAAKNDVTKNDAAKNDVAKTACGNDFWARRDPACLAPKLRRVRVRDATERAALAGVPIGRATTAEVNAPTDAVTNQTDAPQACRSGIRRCAGQCDGSATAPPVAAPKKSQRPRAAKIVGATKRRRSLWRDERADGVRGYGDGRLEAAEM
jgi:hypothetical protein